MLPHLIPMRNPVVLAVLSVLFATLQLPATALATSATIAVSGNEGTITISATASFSTHEFCSGSGDDKECWTIRERCMSIAITANSTASQEAVRPAGATPTMPA